MKTTDNTILITGRGSGIGLEMAKLLSAENDVIITGRNGEKLNRAALNSERIFPIISDLTNPEDVRLLTEQLRKEHPNLNVVINNAGHVQYYRLDDPLQDAYENAAAEINTNYLGTIRLNQALLPLLKSKEQAAIVTISSITTFVPVIGITSYAISKAALHTYLCVLRATLSQSSPNVKVFEIMPPGIQ